MVLNDAQTTALFKDNEQMVIPHKMSSRYSMQESKMKTI